MAPKQSKISIHAILILNEPSTDPKLLNQLQTQHQTWPHQTDLEIREVSYLWTYSSPCAVAFSAPGKATNVPATEAKALLQFMVDRVLLLCDRRSAVSFFQHHIFVECG